MNRDRDTVEPSVPPTLRSGRRRALGIALVLVVVVVAAVIGDLVTGSGFGEITDDKQLVAAEVLDDDGALNVRYRHPDTDREVVAPLPVFDVEPPAPGQTVDLVVGADPMLVELRGDRFGPKAFLGSYVVIVALAVALAAYATWRVARIRRLVRSRARGQVMSRPAVGVMSAGTGLRHRSSHLHVYALDAHAGDAPLCSVPLATVPIVGAGCRFPLEVWGAPRRFGRVAARSGDTLLWPRRRALLLRTGPLLIDGEFVPPSVPRAVPAPTTGLDRGAVLRRLGVPLAVTAASLALLIPVTLVTVRNAAATDEWIAGAEVAVAEVVAHRDDLEHLELLVRDSDRRVVAPVDFTADYPIGIDYPVFVDPDPDVGTARLVARGYDTAYPIGSASIPLWFATAWLLWRAVGLAAVSRTARRGPWNEYTATVHDAGRSADVTIVDRFDRPVAMVPLGADVSNPTPARISDGRRSLVVAGDLGPGAVIAVWLDAAGPASPSGAVRPPRPDELYAGAVHPGAVYPGAVYPGVAPVGGAADGPPRSDVVPVLPVEGVRIPLTGAWLHRRKPELRVVGDKVELFAPQWFGSARWSIPLSELAVFDVGSEPDRDIPWPDEQLVVFAERLKVADLPTGGRHRSVTLGLFFRTPRPVPPLRWTHLGSALSPRASRSDAGLVLDGVVVSAESSRQAVAVLRDAGVEVITNPVRWWIRHRRVERDPQRRAELVRRDRIERWCRGASTVVGFAALASAWLLERSWGTPTIALTCVLVAVGVSLRLVSKHAARDD